jgi:hypothetical protein
MVIVRIPPGLINNILQYNYIAQYYMHYIAIIVSLKKYCNYIYCKIDCNILLQYIAIIIGIIVKLTAILLQYIAIYCKE